jgi:hypothetical protein
MNVNTKLYIYEARVYLSNSREFLLLIKVFMKLENFFHTLDVLKTNKIREDNIT